jgi:hypothetical protein
MGRVIAWEPSEEQIQRAVVDLLVAGAIPGLVWTHVPHGEYRPKATGGRLKGMGVRPGWPDLLLVMAGPRVYGLEIKRQGGKLSAVQIETHELLRSMGVDVVTTYGEQAAIDQIVAWGMLREGVSVARGRS